MVNMKQKQHGKQTLKLKSKLVFHTEKKIHYIKITINQMMIMDAVMVDGGIGKYVGKHSDTNYSEHAGLLDFNKQLERISISAKTNREDHDDKGILFPDVDFAEVKDYEYIFHTHPPSPHPGARAKLGIIYELPSPGDFLVFIDLFNRSLTQGSIIIAPEGAYVIRPLNMHIKKIDINEDQFFDDVEKTIDGIHECTAKQYGTKLSVKRFYAIVTTNTKPIQRLNDFLKPYGIHVTYKPRIKKKGRWILNAMYLPVFVTELA